MATVYLALGSNVGNSRRNIEQAIEMIDVKARVVKQASIYLSHAVGVTDQPDFYNTVVMAETDLLPSDLLVFVKDIEKQVGRIERFRWGPREIDIDIIFYDDLVIDTPTLTIPHPRFAEREFVLQPLTDIDPAFIDPRSHLSIQELLSQLSEDATSIFQKLR